MHFNALSILKECWHIYSRVCVCAEVIFITIEGMYMGLGPYSMFIQGIVYCSNSSISATLVKYFQLQFVPIQLSF